MEWKVLENIRFDVLSCAFFYVYENVWKIEGAERNSLNLRKLAASNKSLLNSN